MPTYDQATSQIDSQDDLVCFATGTNLTAVALFHIFDTTRNQVAASPTFGGASMTQVVEISQTYTTNRWHMMEAWVVDGVSSGSNTFSYDFTEAATAAAVTLITFSGANNGTGAIASASGNGTTISVNLTGQQSESLLITGGMITGGDTDPFTGSAITLRTNGDTGINANADIGYFSGDRSSTTGSDHLGAEAAVSDEWSIIAFELFATASAPGGGGDLERPTVPIIVSMNHYRGGVWT